MEQLSEMPSEYLYSSYVIYTFLDESEAISASINDEYSLFCLDSYTAENEWAHKQADLLSSHYPPPSMIAGLITAYPARMGTLSQIRRELIKQGVADIPEPTLLQSYEFTEIRDSLTASTRVLVTTQAKLIVKMARELSQLRRLVEELRNTQRDIDSFMQRRGIKPQHLAYASHLGRAPEQSIAIHQDGIQNITQVFPTSSQGVNSFAIHINNYEPTSSAASITLHSVEDSKLQGRWEVASGELQHGWNVFSLSRSLGGMSRTLRIRIAANGEGAPINISLGELQPIERFQVRDKAGQKSLSDRHIALLVWIGIPGLIATDFANMSDLETPVEIKLRGNILSATSAQGLLSHSRVDLTVDREGGAIVAQADQSDIVTIRVPAVLSRRCVRVSVEVWVPPERAAAALVAIGPNPDSGNDTSPSHRVKNAIQSDWVFVAPNAKANVSLSLSAPLTDTSDLLIFAKTADRQEGFTLNVEVRSIVLFLSDTSVV